MMNTLTILAGVMLLILQSGLGSVATWVGWGHGIPNLVLPLVMLLAFREPSLTHGVLLSFVLGYLVDVFSAAPVGLNTFIAIVVFGIARLFHGRVVAGGIAVPMMWGLALALVEGALVVILTAIFGGDDLRARMLVSFVLPHAVATGLCAPLVVLLYGHLQPSRGFAVGV